jgi:hypothetical protein
MKFNKLIFATLFLAFALVGPAIQAGDVIDFLPEVQVARSITPAIEFAIVFEEDCVGVQVNQEVPNNLLFDDNGQARTFEQMGEILLQLNCSFQSLAFEDLENSSANIPLFLDAFSGNLVEFSNGLTLDGRKQTVRASLIFSHLLLFQFELGGVFDFDILGSDPCGQLRTWSKSGSSLELQFVAFLTLGSDIFSSEEEGLPRQCSTAVGGTEAELIALAEAGDLDASLDLMFFWTLELQAIFGDEPTADDLPSIEAQMDRFELLILRNTMKFPFVTLAAQLPLANLYLFEHELTN